VTSVTPKSKCSTAELLSVMSSRILEDGSILFAGVGIPLLAATLAQRMHAPHLTILFEGGVVGPHIESGKLPPSTNEARTSRKANMVPSPTDVLALLQRGYVDYGFMGGAQVDQYGNLNSSFIGDPTKPKIRLPGSGGGESARLGQMGMGRRGLSARRNARRLSRPKDRGLVPSLRATNFLPLRRGPPFGEAA